MPRAATISEALVRKLIRAARAEGWHEVRLCTPVGDVVLSDGQGRTPTQPDVDAVWEAFDRGEL